MLKPGNSAIDWWRVIVDLERHGYSQANMAAAAGVGISTLKDWKNLGAEPRHSSGERLLDFWSRVQGETLESAPRTVRPISAARMEPKGPRQHISVRPELGEAVRGWATL